jgi:hypothetical protein
VVKKTMTAMSASFPQYRFSLAFTIEGRETAELPEALAGASTMCKFDWTMLKPFPPPRTPAASARRVTIGGGGGGSGGGGEGGGADAAGDGGGATSSDEEEVTVNRRQVGTGRLSTSSALAIGQLPDEHTAASLVARAAAAVAEPDADGGSDPELHARMASAVFERVLPQVRELEGQGAYCAASEVLAAALVEAKAIGDEGLRRLGAAAAADAAADAAAPTRAAADVGSTPAAPAGAPRARSRPRAPPSTTVASIERLKQVGVASRQYRGRLYVLSRQVHGMKWRARVAQLDGQTLRLFKVARGGRVSTHARPFLLKVRERERERERERDRGREGKGG